MTKLILERWSDMLNEEVMQNKHGCQHGIVVITQQVTGLSDTIVPLYFNWKLVSSRIITVRLDNSVRAIFKS